VLCAACEYQAAVAEDERREAYRAHWAEVAERDRERDILAKLKAAADDDDDPFR
jgi:hypothetical protein